METRRQSKRKEPAGGAPTQDSDREKRRRQPQGSQPETQRAGAEGSAAPAAPSRGNSSGREIKKAPVPVSPKGQRSRSRGSARSAHNTANKGKGKAKSEAKAPAMDTPGRSSKAEPPGGHQHVGSDDDDELGNDMNQQLASASSALQGLLKKLGAGFDDILPAGFGYSHGRLKNILSILKKEEGPQQLDAVSQLCEILSISSEEALTTFPVDEFVPILVRLLNEEHSPDMMLLAARSLTFLADVLPSSCTAIVSYNAIPAFCARLLNIEYIDLAEQSLQALGKISAEHPGACLQAGGMCAVLSFLDFFPTSMQHVAVVTAANMAHGAGPETMEQVKSAVELLTNLLQHHDPKVVDNSCLALSRLADGISHSPEHLDDFCSKSLIQHVLQLIALTENGGMSAGISVSTYFGLIKLLATCSAGQPHVAQTLLEHGLSSTLHCLLSSSALLSSSFSPVSTLKSVDQLSEVLSLASALLPDVPDASAAAVSDTPVLDLGLSPRESGGDSTRVAFLAANPLIMQTFGIDLLGQLLQIYSGTIALDVREKCLLTITKVLHFSSEEVLKEVLRNLPISSFLASLLIAKEACTVASALQMAEILMIKMPSVLVTHFLKEGVVHAVEQLAATAPAQKPPAPPRMQTRSAFRSRKVEEEPAKTAAGAEPRTPSGTLLRTSVASWAARFHKTYFTDAGISSDSLDTEGLKVVRAVCADILATKPGAVSTLMKQLQDTASQRVTTFEFLKSGAVESLQVYLSGSDLEASTKESKLLHRLALFVTEALPAGSGECPPLVGLVNKLQEALASTEAFPVLMSEVRPSSSSSRHNSSNSHSLNRSSSPHHSQSSRGTASATNLGTGLAALSQPFKLRLCRETGAQGLRDYSSNVVLIEPLATMRAIEDFLWARVQVAQASQDGGPSSDGLHREAQAAGAAAGEKSAGQPLPMDKHAAASQRMTRSAAARATAAAEAEGSRKGPPEGLGEEDVFGLPGQRGDEADGASEDEDMDGDMMFDDEDEDEEDELDELGMSMGDMAVHDVTKPTPVQGGTSAVVGTSAKGSGSGNDPSAPAASAQAGRQAAAASRFSSGDTHKLQFKMNGVYLSSSATIFQAILQGSQAASDTAEADADGAEAADNAPTCSFRLWEKVYSITYCIPSSQDSGRDDEKSIISTTTAAKDDFKSGHYAPVSGDAALLALLQPAALEGLEASSTTLNILSVLRQLDAINRCRGRLMTFLGRGCSLGAGYVPHESFNSRKLAPKLSQQLQDVLAICGGGLPAWSHTLTARAPFLFPFEARRRYFYCTALGLARALQHLQQAQVAEGAAGARGGTSSSSDGREARLARLQRQKVRVNRTRILDSAVKVMELYAPHRAVLEVEYVGEVGTGLGPTLEFYTLLSHELQRKGLGMWREGDAGSTAGSSKHVKPVANQEAATASGEPLITALNGLFPVSILDTSTTTANRTMERFKLLGRMLAKALQDNRILDLPLSRCFYRAILGRPLDLHDIGTFDPQLGSSLLKLSQAARSRLPNGQVQIDSMPVDDLCLQFTLPGQEDCELKPGGRDIAVTSSNVEEYLALVVDALLGSGIAAQLDAFRQGFNEVFPLSHLKCFYEDELEMLLCGSDDPWDVNLLLNTIKFDHGYSSESVPVGHFVEALCELDAKDRRAFLRFVTGSPRLPPGGLNALHPTLTVVRKSPSQGEGTTPGTTPGTPGMRLEGTTLADNDLLSVMTCANYIKLPPYSCKEVLVDRVMYAIREGQCSFDLS